MKISNSMRGHLVTEQTKDKLRKIKAGKKRKPHSPETIEKIKISNKKTADARPKRVWSELDKAIHSERMKAIWEIKNHLTKSVRRF